MQGSCHRALRMASASPKMEGHGHGKIHAAIEDKKASKRQAIFGACLKYLSLLAICVMSTSIRLFSVVKYESVSAEGSFLLCFGRMQGTRCAELRLCNHLQVIHEFDP